jgi:hypothetical protein
MLGGLWYSKMLFGNAWIKHSNINMNDPDAKKGVGQIMFASFLLMLVATIGLALLLSKVELSNWMSGAKVGLIAGLCFSATSICITFLYEKRPMALHLINACYHIAGCILAGIILALWK